MKTPLDLTCEFAALDDAKTRCKGALPLLLENRWAELKGFYDLLMAWNGIAGRADIGRYTVAEIRRKLTVRQRLRVPAEMDLFFHHRGVYHTAKLVNLSCKGALLTADSPVDRGSRLTLYLIKTDRGGIPFLRTDGEVVWSVAPKVAETEQLHDKMGIRFIELAKPVQDELESFVIETIERQLLGFDARALAPEFVCHEQLVP
jgi:hypothetical protein